MLECGNVFVFFGEFLAGQHRIDPLDRGNDNRRTLVEAGRAELLHAVEFGKQPASAGRPIGGIFGGGLIAEIAAIDQKQHAPHAGMGQHPVGSSAGGEGLARTHGHLDERAGVIAGQ